MLTKYLPRHHPAGRPDDVYRDPVSAIVGTSVLGGVGQAIGARKAAKTEANSAAAAQKMQREMFDISRQDQMPWMQAGQAGLNQYASMMGLKQGEGGTYAYDPATAANAAQMMQADPGYQFRMNQGQRALENSAAARGGLLSGNTARALTEYGQDYGSQEFQNILNRYAALSGIGQNQAQNIAGQRANMASNVGNAMMQGGAARASGYTGMGNAITDAMSSGMGLYGAKQGWFK